MEFLTYTFTASNYVYGAGRVATVGGQSLGKKCAVAMVDKATKRFSSTAGTRVWRYVQLP